MERKVVFFAYCGLGTETAEAFIVPEGWTAEALDKEVWQFAIQHADLYGVYPPEYDEDGEEIEQEEGLHGYTWDNVESRWEAYDAEKHDVDLLRGSQKEVSWNQL